MNRHQARELAFFLLFEHEFDKERTADEIYETAKELREDVEEDEYVRAVLSGVLENEARIETLISENAKGWSLRRISKVSLAVLKLSTYEMLYRPDIPIRVSLNESVELVKKYDDERARAFVNGILNTIAGIAAQERPDET